MTKTELSELREAFKLDVLLGGDPDATPLPCWFAENVPDAGDCEGSPRAAHFLKRRRIEKLCLGGGLWVDDGYGFYFDDDLVQLAAWDPRNAVPSCEAHDMRHDSLQMPPLVVPAHLAPLDAAMFCLDWGFEHELERRCPFFSAECPNEAEHRISALDLARSERALFDG